LSIGCWLVAQLPQLYRNYKNQTSESLSIAFLINWFRYFSFSAGLLFYSNVDHVSLMTPMLFFHSGDLANLLGCILTDQLPIQKITAVYYLIMDIVILSQYKFVYHSCHWVLFHIFLPRYYDWKKSRRTFLHSSVNGTFSVQQPLLAGHQSLSSDDVVISTKGKRAASGLAASLAMVCSALFSLYSCSQLSSAQRACESLAISRFALSQPPSLLHHLLHQHLRLLHPHPLSLPRAGYLSIPLRPLSTPHPRPPPHFYPLPHPPPPLPSPIRVLFLQTAVADTVMT
jgi:uncharacterized protein with PQ loop repeat